MTRLTRSLLLLIPFLGGLLPLLVYWSEHGGLGTPIFADQRAMTAGQQIAQVAAGLYIKPLYMLISLALILLLWEQTRLEIRALFWGLTAFLTGEIFCGLNFLVYKHASLISEYIHSYGMVIALGCIAFAALEILDRRLLHINDAHCAVAGLCRTCRRATPLQCAARRTALMTLILASILSLLPLAVSSTPRSYLTELFGYPYSYARFDLYQWYEARALPLIALALFLLALIPLLSPKGDPLPQPAKLLFSAGVGALGFSLFRLTLAGLFAEDLVWFEFWEELTELMFTSAMALLLWQFRDSLLRRTSLTDLILHTKLPEGG
jgi:hypothetical protein